MTKYIQIDGIVEMPNNMMHEEFMDLFIDWLEEKECYFGGGFYPVDEDGNKTK